MNKLRTVKQKPQQQQQQQQQQQSVLSAPSVSFNMEEIREARRNNALKILDEVLPSMVVRLRDLHQRSKSAADQRWGFSAAEGQGGSTVADGPSTVAKRRTLVSQLKKLVKAGTDLLQQHSELLQEGKEKSFERKSPANAKLLEKLTGEAEKLTETYRKIRHANKQEEEDNQRRYLDEARLVLGHPIFEVLRPEEEPMEQQLEEVEDAVPPSDHLVQTPLFDTAELIALVACETRKVVECSHDLKSWVSLSAPPMDVVTEYEDTVRNTIVEIIDDIVDNCEVSLKYPEEYLSKRKELEARAIEQPLSIERMRLLDAFEKTKAIEWRRQANSLILQCLLVMDFVTKHAQVLGEWKPQENPAAHLYS